MKTQRRFAYRMTQVKKLLNDFEAQILTRKPLKSMEDTGIVSRQIGEAVRFSKGAAGFSVGQGVMNSGVEAVIKRKVSDQVYEVAFDDDGHDDSDRARQVSASSSISFVATLPRRRPSGGLGEPAKLPDVLTLRLGK
jgi:hypothetical protein